VSSVIQHAYQRLVMSGHGGSASLQVVFTPRSLQFASEGVSCRRCACRPECRTCKLISATMCDCDEEELPDDLPARERQHKFKKLAESLAEVCCFAHSFIFATATYNT
jgi:hypothetical protein